MKEIKDFFFNLFDTSDWPPRWHCGNWSGFHGWLYIISDLLIWAAYFAIPIIIIRYITYRKHQRFIKLYFLFAGFILACGATHFLDAISFWIPLYRVNALVRAITAIVSWLTVFTLIKILPYAFSLKEPKLLEDEIEMRRQADIDLHKKNEELEESRQTFKSAFDYSSIGIALVSLQGQWLTVNQAACNMLGYTEEELLKLTFQDITYPQDLAADLEHVNELLERKKEAYQMEKRYYRKDGSLVYVLLSVSLVWKEDRPNFFISQLVDISLSHRLATELQKKNAALEVANKELQGNIARANEFNRIIGHNLRGPASSMINAAEYLEATDNEDDRKLLLSKMKSTSLSILKTINDLTEFLEIQLSHETQDAPVLFNEALQSSLHILQDQVNQAGAVINTHFDVENVAFPKVYLESLFYNLVSNALKYRETTRATVIDIETKADGDLVVLTVKDNGIGINLEKYGSEIFKYKKIFHRGYDSNGVGLFLTKTQIEAYNGKIEVNSKLNEGTTFTIYFKHA